MVYSTRRFVLCFALCYFVLVFFGPFSIAITSLGEERASLGAFCTFVRFALVWFCLFPIPVGVWEGLRFVIVAIPGHFSYLFFLQTTVLFSNRLYKPRLRWLLFHEPFVLKCNNITEDTQEMPQSRKTALPRPQNKET